MKTKRNELFERVVDVLRESGRIPEHLEYYQAGRPRDEDYLIDGGFCVGTLSRGNEGITVIMEQVNTKGVRFLGIFKTLRSNREAWDSMAQLMADFQWECNELLEGR